VNASPRERSEASHRDRAPQAGTLLLDDGVTAAVPARHVTAADFRLDGQAIVIAGASRGIGAASAIACAEAGAASVALLGRGVRELEQVAEQVAQAGAEPLVRRCDISSTAAIEDVFTRLERVDVLVNSAGTNRPQRFTQVDEQTYDELFALNVRGAFFLAQAAVRLMRKHENGGTIINISSQMGHVGAPLRTVYCATKHAIEGLTKALAVELAPCGIRALSIAPTFVRTDMTAAQLDDPEIGQRLLDQIPRGRFGTVEEVAAAVIYAASPAASLMTGTSLVLDGGWTAR
jgi:NAD(P)-dependent dehydrogenase (short-subunit alcohol dehydrogenase family)